MEASCFPSELNEGEFSTSRSGRFSPEKMWVGTDWRLCLNIETEKNLFATRSKFVVESVVSWVINERFKYGKCF